MTPPETATVRYSPSTTIGAWSIACCSSTARRASSRLVAHVAQQHREFLAAPARDAVVRSHSGTQAASDLDEHAIARTMPEGVVDLLEVVEVEQHEAAVVPGLERQRDMLAEREPVVRSRDDVGARLLLGLHAQLAQLDVGAAQLVDAQLQAALELTAIADVEHEAQPDVAAVARVVRDVAIEHPALDAVVADEAVGSLELRPVRERLGLSRSKSSLSSAWIRSIHSPRDASPSTAAPPVKRSRLGLALTVCQTPSLVALDHVDVRVHGLEHVLELGLAGRQRCRRGAARGDVGRDADDLDRAARELLALGALAQPARDAVGAAQAELDARVGARHLRCHEGLVGGPVVRVHRGHPVLGILVGLDAAQERVAVRALIGLVVGALFVEPARVEVLLELDQQPLDRLGAQQALVLAPDVLDHADDGAVAVGGGALAHVQQALARRARGTAPRPGRAREPRSRAA